MAVSQIIALVLSILAMVLTIASTVVHIKIEKNLEDTIEYWKNEYNTALVHIAEEKQAAEAYKKVIEQQKQYIHQLEQYNEYITRR